MNDFGPMKNMIKQLGERCGKGLTKDGTNPTGQRRTNHGKCAAGLKCVHGSMYIGGTCVESEVHQNGNMMSKCFNGI